MKEGARTGLLNVPPVLRVGAARALRSQRRVGAALLPVHGALARRPRSARALPSARGTAGLLRRPPRATDDGYKDDAAHH